MQRFVLTAEMQLRAPSSANITSVRNSIVQGLRNVDVNVNVQGARAATEQVKKLSDATEKAKTSADKLVQTFAFSFRRFVTFSIASRVVSGFTSDLRDAVSEAIEFEREMTKVAQVSGRSVQQLKGLSDEITRLSTNFGVSSASLVTVSRTLTQAGFSANETRVALESLAKSELAPTFDNITETTEGAVAIFNQFGRGAEALEGQLGAINAVAGKFAVESGDLISAVRRAGGVFKAAGNDLDELNALFTTIRATTRLSAESIATGLRTIAIRVQRPETIRFLESLNSQLEATGTRIDLIQNGRFVGVFEAFRQLNEVIGELPAGSQLGARIAQEVGGVRQVDKILPLLNNFKIAQDALNTSIEGQNSLTKDADIALETLGSRLERTRQQFIALTRDIFNSGSFQFLANTAISLTESLIGVASALKDILPLLTAVGTFQLARSFGPAIGKFARGAVQGFNSGGQVGGVGNTDTVPAMLTPGEFVINKRAVRSVGVENLKRLNSRGRSGGATSSDGVQFFMNGGLVGGFPGGNAGLAVGASLVLPAIAGLADDSSDAGLALQGLSNAVLSAGTAFFVLEAINKKSNSAQESYNRQLEVFTKRVSSLEKSIAKSDAEISRLTEGDRKTIGLKETNDPRFLAQRDNEIGRRGRGRNIAERNLTNTNRRFSTVNRIEGLKNLVPRSLTTNLAKFDTNLTKLAGGATKFAGIVAAAGVVVQEFGSFLSSSFTEAAKRNLEDNDFDSFRSNSRSALVGDSIGNIGSRIGGGALAGGTAGAAIGAAGGPIGLAGGAAIGAVGGLIVGAFESFKTDFIALREIETQIFESSLKQASEILNEFSLANVDGQKSLQEYSEALRQNRASFEEDLQLAFQESSGKLDTNIEDFAASFGASLGSFVDALGSAASSVGSFFSFFGSLSFSDVFNFIERTGDASLKFVHDSIDSAQQSLSDIRTSFASGFLGLNKLTEQDRFNRLDTGDQQDIINRQRQAISSQIDNLSNLGLDVNSDSFKLLEAEIRNDIEARRSGIKQLDEVNEQQLRSLDNLRKAIQDRVLQFQRIEVTTDFNRRSLELNSAITNATRGFDVFQDALNRIEFSTSNLGDDGIDTANSIKRATESIINDIGVDSNIGQILERESSLAQNAVTALGRIRNLTIGEGDSETIRDVLNADIQGLFEDQNLGSRVADIITESLGNGEINQFTIPQALEELGPTLQREIGNSIQPLQEALRFGGELVRKEIEILSNNIASARRSFIENQRASLELEERASRDLESFGGNAGSSVLRFAIRDANLQASQIAAGRNSANNGQFSITDASQISQRGDEIEQRILDITDQLNSGVSSFEFSRLENERTQLQSLLGTFADVNKRQIDAINENIRVQKEKNKVEQESLQSLLDGDIESFLRGQAASGAQAAIATGDERLIRSFGRTAISDAVQNFRDLEESGVNSFLGRDIGGRGGLREAGAAAGLELVGITDVRQVRALAGTTEELERLNRQGRGVSRTGLSLADNQRNSSQGVLNGDIDRFSGVFSREVNRIASDQQNLNIPNNNGPLVSNRNSSVNANSSSANSTRQATADSSLRGNGTLTNRPLFGDQDRQNLDLFVRSTERLNEAVERLSQTQIQVSLAPSTVNVNLSGGEFLQKLQPEIQRVIFMKVKETFEDFGSRLSSGANPSDAARNSTPRLATEN